MNENENERIIDEKRETTEELDTFFSKIIYLNILKYNNCDPLANKISGPVEKAIVKYRNKPSILKIGKVFTYLFSCVVKDETFKEVLSLQNAEAWQTLAISSKFTKENADICRNYFL